MALNVEKSRQRIKRSILTGVTPTWRADGDFTDGTWLNTEIRSGELFYNVVDQKLWIGTSTGVQNITASLASVLANGEHTGAHNIIIDTNQVIKSGNGGGQINLDYSGAANNVFISTDNGANTQSFMYMNPNEASFGGTYGFLNITSIGVELITNTGLLKLNGMYNTLQSNDIIVFKDNFSSSLTSSNLNDMPGVIISGRNCTVGASSRNSIFLGVNNTATSAESIISGANNTISSASSSIISGTSNTGAFQRSIVSGSGNNITTLLDSIISGVNNTTTTGPSSSSIISGSNNTSVTCNKSIITGFYNNIGIISNSMVSGTYNTVGNLDSSIITGAYNNMINPGLMYGNINGNGSVILGSNGFSSLGKKTNNATPAILFVNGTGLRFNIPSNSAYRVKLTLIGRNTTSGDCIEYSGNGIIKNVAGTTSLVGSGISMSSNIGDVSLIATAVMVTADNANSALQVQVTGIAATTINWVCGIQYEKVV